MLRKAMFAVAVLAVGCLIGCDSQKSSGANKSQNDWDPSEGRKLGANEKIKIGFIVKQAEEPWFQDEWKYAKEAGEKYGFEVITLDAKDGEKVISSINSLGSQGAQGFIICTPDVKLGPTIIETARNHKLKVMSVDDQLVNGDAFMNIHHMGIDAPNIGKAMGEALVKLMGDRKWDPKEVAFFVPTFDKLDTARERYNAAVDAVKASGFPEKNIFRVAQKTSDVQGGYDAANIAFTQHGNFKKWIICGMNDEAVIGSVRALEGHNLTADNVIGVGIGGAKSAQDEFRSKERTGFVGTILISPRLHGFDTAEIMYKWIKTGEEPERKPIFTKGYLITRDDFRTKLKELGLTER